MRRPLPRVSSVDGVFKITEAYQKHVNGVLPSLVCKVVDVDACCAFTSICNGASQGHLAISGE